MRLEGQAKMGYYPTPEGVTNTIIERLDIKNDGWGVTILDPSCGNADVLKVFKKKFPKIKTIGVELDGARADTAKEEIGCNKCIVKGDALNAIVRGKAQILFLNPPYDWADGDKTKRLETLFIEKYLSVLEDNGVFIAVLPFLKPLIDELIYRIDDVVDDCLIIPFPEDDFGFKQFVLMGVKEDKRYKQTDINAVFRRMNDTLYNGRNDYNSLLEIAKSFNFERENYKYQVPFSSISNLKIINNTFDYAKVQESIQKDKILQQAIDKVWTARISARDKIRPLTNLRQGHLAMILAGGYINGVVEKDGKKIVVKGKVEQKTEFSSAELKGDNKLKTTETTFHAVSLKVLDLNNGEISVVE